MDKKTLYNSAFEALAALQSLDTIMQKIGVDPEGIYEDCALKNYHLIMNTINECLGLEIITISNFNFDGYQIKDYFLQSKNGLFVNECKLTEVLCAKCEDQTMIDGLWDIFVEDKKELTSSFRVLYHCDICEAETTEVVDNE